MTARTAAFVDRDGTIIRDANYIRDPNDVALLPGAASAIARLNGAGVAVIVVTNQSGIARGWLSDDDYQSVRRRVDDMLGAQGARIDATYTCPHLPEISGPCDCRKPGLRLYRDAISDLDLDAAKSLFCGDRLRDVTPGIALGGRAILLDVASTPADDRARASADGIEMAASLSEAVDRFLAALPASSRGQ